MVFILDLSYIVNEPLHLIFKSNDCVVYFWQHLQLFLCMVCFAMTLTCGTKRGALKGTLWGVQTKESLTALRLHHWCFWFLNFIDVFLPTVICSFLSSPLLKNFVQGCSVLHISLMFCLTTKRIINVGFAFKHSNLRTAVQRTLCQTRI